MGHGAAGLPGNQSPGRQHGAHPPAGGPVHELAGPARPGCPAPVAATAGLADETGLYLDLTGLGCYHKQDLPPWYDALEEAQRWEVQARFWSAIARACRGSPAVFCYDLMNEPVIGGGKPGEWLTGELGGK